MKPNDCVGFTDTVQYRIEKRLGEGAFGIVWRAKSLRSGVSVAIKEMSLDEGESIYRELTLMLHFKECPQLTQIFGAVGSDAGVVLIMELLDMDLHQWLELKVQEIEVSHVKLLFYQILAALHWLHGSSVIHRDVKLANMLLYKECYLKLCDLGEAQIAGEEKYTRIGLYEPRPPELLVTPSPYTAETDTWSAGIAFQKLMSVVHKQPELIDEESYEMSPEIIMDKILKVTGTPDDEAFDRLIIADDCTPEEANCPPELMGEDVFEWDEIKSFAQACRANKYKETQKFDFVKNWPNMDPAAADLLSKLLMFDPATRISIAEALTHPYFVDDENFMSEVSKMGVAVDLDRKDQTFKIPKETLPVVIKRLEKEASADARLGKSRADEYYFQRKRVIGNMLISPLVIPQDVANARRTMFRKRNNGVGGAKRKPSNQIPRCATSGSFSTLMSMPDSPKYTPTEGIIRSNSIAWSNFIMSGSAF
eukprot:TRINITY_DN3079_c0_g1_i4.p1 TRINITY_DN3079_c0_g1~~TRINITY_DN3079_c0_g1_i4.p1  ORF type:complete len:479 (+),score=89.27 TRINITY_DN3079_c0_g1_i4:127-1563(+)